jgi:RNA polymerase sigma-70 factor (sigma-E family)
MSETPVEDPEAEADRRVEWPTGLVELYQERFVDFARLAYLLTGRRDVAEELTQDAFVAIASRWDTVDTPAAYVRTSVVNRSRSWFRRIEVEERHRPVPDPPRDLEVDELWDALATLPERRRAAIVLRFYLDLPDPEIAEVLGCRPATVRTSIHRGLAQLRKEIEP